MGYAPGHFDPHASSKLSESTRFTSPPTSLPADGCVNLAGLLPARAITRRGDTAVHASLARLERDPSRLIDLDHLWTVGLFAVRGFDAYRESVAAHPS